jgi:hypothetical protein
MRAKLAKKFSGQCSDFEAEKIFDLAENDEHRDAVGETDDERARKEFDQVTHAHCAHRDQHAARHDGADEQVGVTVLRDDAVHDDDERARRPADLHTRTAQERDDEAGDDGGEDARFRFRTGCDREGDSEWQSDHADRDTCGEVGSETRAVIAAQGIN